MLGPSPRMLNFFSSWFLVGHFAVPAAWGFATCSTCSPFRVVQSFSRIEEWDLQLFLCIPMLFMHGAFEAVKIPSGMHNRDPQSDTASTSWKSSTWGWLHYAALRASPVVLSTSTCGYSSSSSPAFKTLALWKLWACLSEWQKLLSIDIGFSNIYKSHLISTQKGPPSERISDVYILPMPRRQHAAQATTITPRWQTLWRQHGPFGGTLARIFGPRIWRGRRTPLWDFHVVWCSCNSTVFGGTLQSSSLLGLIECVIMIVSV